MAILGYYWHGSNVTPKGRRNTKVRKRVVKLGDDRREVTASLEDGKSHKECGQLLGATNDRKRTLLWERSPVRPLSTR